MICHWDEVPWAPHELGELRFVHRADGEAHTLLAGDDAALDVLAFASGSPTGLTVLPRAGVTWVGSRWLTGDAPHPFRAEPALADDLPPRAQRPPSIVALDSVTPQAQEHGRVQRTRRALADAAGSVLSGLQHVEVAPGKRSSTRHCHSQEEELFVAHAFQASPDGLTLLAYGTRDCADLCWYPDSQKIAFRGLKLIARVQPLDYWDGEQ